ncbi:DUF3558 domain-containing protein [Amycolatopsis panacis]|uniref:DUF3558 domain-containing protein n=1 Tax=Amycolatopsis panacis TaxID=2340917 RepID=A0A419I4N1_9PSEU|nr:DUF3558 domain-containing protein [Amycolatopsis panacis]
MAGVSRFGGVAALLVVTCAMAACSTTTAGIPEPGATSSPASADPAVPKVDHPLPSSLIQGDPCAVLTSAQVDSLFSNTPTRSPQKDTGVAKFCSWHDLERGSQVAIQLVYAWKRGLTDVYATQGRGGLFKVLAPVQGYPVVAYGPRDDRSKGSCGVAVGIADNAAFEADATVASSAVGTGDPCEDARKVANLAVTTLKGTA